jgi:PleD family two-component response regulator
MFNHRRAVALVVTADAPTAQMLRSRLAGEAIDTHVVPDGQHGLRAAQNLLPDLVVCDSRLADMRYSQFCAALVSDTRTRHIPALILGGADDKTQRLAALDAGADGYAARPLDYSEVAIHARALLRRARLKPAINPLTGLPGNLIIEQEIRRFTSNPATPFAVVYVDLNHFKAYNDVYGFAAGDEAIRLLARILTAAVAELGAVEDLVGHIGGDDFVVLTSLDRCEAIGQRIVAEFDRLAPELYTPADRRRGYITTRDRQGILRKFSLLTVAVGIVHNERRLITSHYEVAEIGAELKRFAKSRGVSAVVKDQRHG